MTNEQKRKHIILFMRKKGEALGDAYPTYFTEEDEEELKEWPPEEVDDVWTFLDEVITTEWPADSTVCPWCISMGAVCRGCGYGKRHGPCGSLTSEYYSFQIGCCPEGIVSFLEREERPVEDLWEEARKEVTDD